MAKLGREYEIALFDIVRQIDPSAKVTHGTWVDGPDGSREIDVLIEFNQNGQQAKLIFECKDYRANRRLGIGVVDAFESKLRDMGAQGGAICSNADFAEPARNKASRCGIGLIAILRDAKKTPYEIIDVFERREIVGSVTNMDVTLDLEKGRDPSVNYWDLKLFSNCTLRETMAYIFKMGVVTYPVVNGRPRFRYDFGESAHCGEFEGNGLNWLMVSGSIHGAWLRKKVKISAQQALYLWLPKSVLPVEGPVTYHDAVFNDPNYWAQESIFSPEADRTIISQHRSTASIGISINTLTVSGFAKEPEGIKEISRNVDISKISIVGASAGNGRSITRAAYRKYMKSSRPSDKDS